MLSPIDWFEHYLHWLSQKPWRCIVGLYLTGVLGTLILWGLSKLMVLILVSL
jgi:hypothetical protein